MKETECNNGMKERQNQLRTIHKGRLNDKHRKQINKLLQFEER